MADVTLTTRSGSQDIDGLLTDHQWSRSAPALYYSFPSNSAWTGYNEIGEPEADFEPLNGAQQSAAAAVLASVARFTSLNFLAADPSDAHSAELRFGMTGATESAHAYTPFFDEVAGDIWFNNGGLYDAPVPGNYAYLGFLHEIGHALGFKHPHEAERFGQMPLAHDNMNYTVMSYRSYPGMALDGDGLSNGEFGFPQTFMMYDIAALQHLYGADFSADGGDSVYKWNPTTGELKVNGVVRLTPGANTIFMTIWDGGGIDTYDFSAYTSEVTIDLNPGAWSESAGYQHAYLGDSHSAEGNVANALLYKGDPRSLIENARSGSGRDTLIGNQAANVLASGAGEDSLDGRGGADRMIGGPDSDDYYADDTGDRIVETADGGFEDSVYVSAAVYFLDPNIEEMYGRSTTGGQRLTGNADNNDIRAGQAGPAYLDGGGGADHLVGTKYDDTYVVDNPSDRPNEWQGGKDLVISSISWELQSPYIEHLTLAGARAINGTGNALFNILTGNGAANILDGLGGDDLMRGMGGDDIYKVQTAGDRAVETSADGGIDTVMSAVSYTIGEHVEKLTLTGTGATTGNGNALANILIGNAAANILNGGNGNDRLDGGAGADRMNGGNGDDVFIVDNGADRPVETSATGGIDRVESAVSFTLGANIENLTLTGTIAVRATGNALANSLVGNAAANSLNGGGGADTLDGRGGNDTYHVDNAGDKVVELSAGGGVDLVNSSVGFTLGANVENLTLTGTAANATGNPLNNLLTGNGSANVIKGGGGADTLIGGGGGDTLSGGQGGDLLRGGDGSDKFLFDALLGSGNVDHVADLARGSDRILLDNRVFQSLADGALAASAFKVGSAATDATDRIVYDPSNGALYYDKDGAGGTAAILFAMLDNQPALLAASDFLVI